MDSFVMVVDLDFDLATLICPEHQDMERAGFAGCQICWTHFHLSEEIKDFQNKMNYSLKLLNNQINRAKK